MQDSDSDEDDDVPGASMHEVSMHVHYMHADSQCAPMVIHNMQTDDADNSQSRSGRTEDDCWYDYHEQMDRQEQYHATQCEHALYDLATDLQDTRRAELDAELAEAGERLYPSDYWHAVAGDLDYDTLLAQSNEMRHHEDEDYSDAAPQDYLEEDVYEEDAYEEDAYEEDAYEEDAYEEDDYDEDNYTEDDHEEHDHEEDDHEEDASGTRYYYDNADRH